MSVDYELPACYVRDMALIRPASPTPHHSLYLSNLDDMRHHRIYIKLVLLFRKAPNIEAMKSSLSAVLVPYYPLAGRLKESPENEVKLVVDCTEDGVLFAEAFMDATVDELLKVESALISSWRKLLPSKELDRPFLSIPPLMIQATYLTCGGMILCIGCNHCFTDGMGIGQFVGAWAELCRDPKSPLSVKPCWGREALKPKAEPNTQVHQSATMQACPEPNPFGDEELVPVLLTFGPAMIQQLKQQCSQKLDCTSFEVLTAHVWRCFIRAVFDSRPTDKWTWVGFPVNIRSRVDPPLPIGYYGNAAVSGVAVCDLGRLVSENIYLVIRLLQGSKAFMLSDNYVQWFLGVADSHAPSILPNLFVTQWSKLGFETVDFGLGRPEQLGGHVSDSFPVSLLLPVMDDSKAVKVCITVPKSRALRLECYLKDLDNDGTKDPEEENWVPLQTA